MKEEKKTISLVLVQRKRQQRLLNQYEINIFIPKLFFFFHFSIPNIDFTIIDLLWNSIEDEKKDKREIERGTKEEKNIFRKMKYFSFNLKWNKHYDSSQSPFVYPSWTLDRFFFYNFTVWSNIYFRICMHCTPHILIWSHQWNQ